jgi:Cu-Zn family superoxide dismutase
MKLQAVLTAALAFVAVPALAQAPQAAPKAQEKTQGQGQQKAQGQTVKASLKDATGQTVGDVTLEETPNGLIVRGELSNLPAGEHAIHIHETGKCDAPDFKTAGAHLNPGKKQHGIHSPKGKHAGDLPNLFVAQDGKVRFEFFADGGLKLKGVQDKDGAAVVVHAQADDYKTDPSGEAGGRIACGVVGQ